MEVRLTMGPFPITDEQYKILMAAWRGARIDPFRSRRVATRRPR